MTKQKVSEKRSFEGFDFKTFILGFKKPAIVLITFGLSTLTSYPELTGVITMLGGVSILAERIWAVCEFYFKEIDL